MAQKIARRGALPRLVAVLSTPLAAGTALRWTSAGAEVKPVLQGYGRCASCACPGFTGSYNVSQNCGHNYQTHW